MNGLETWEIPLMRKAGSLLAEVAEIVHQQVKAGVTSLELDHLAESEIRARKCIPAFKGYRNFPNTLCVSVNEQVVHGIPNTRPLRAGDLVTIDMGLSFGGLFADMAFTVQIDSADLVDHLEKSRLVAATEEALAAGIEAVRPGNRVGDIGFAIEAVAAKHGLGVVRSYTGHGIGRTLHARPAIPNAGREGQGSLLTPGMALAIEPMFTLGSSEVDLLPDGWTAVTKDGSGAAHSEHTVLVTETAHEVLTAG